MSEQNPDVKPDAEIARIQKQKSRNRAIGWALAALILMFYLVTIVKLGPNILSRPL